MGVIRQIEPQEGYQIQTLSSSADIVISGGAAGVGKTFTLLLEFLRHYGNKEFGGVIFRRTFKQIHAQGGLWDTSVSLYSTIKNSKARESDSLWTFPSGSKLKFNHLEHEKNVYDWQGSQIPFIGFDELTHFSKHMFFYMLSRNRSTCGITPYVRATCNPDPDSWVSELIEWWIDQETGFPIPERNGVIRYFFKDNDRYIWGDTAQECVDKAMYMLEDIIDKTDIDPVKMVKSLTFISGDIYSNKKLLSVNPEYLSNLLSQDDETRDQLLHGNWKIKLNEKEMYDYSAFLDIFTNDHILPDKSNKRITADIALKGSDRFVVIYWEGWVIMDITIMDKSDGKQVIEAINAFKAKYGVMNSKIVFDNDGVGGFVDGFIKGAVEFKNGATPINKENYKNLKTQCYYKSSDRVNKGGVYMPPEIAERMYDDKSTVRQRLIFERKAIRRLKDDEDGKLQMISKKEMKVLLNGDSPDILDAIMEVEALEIAPTRRQGRARVIRND